jgi:3D (Asp-Asp-Asp) domain-containing protein
MEKGPKGFAKVLRAFKLVLVAVLANVAVFLLAPFFMGEKEIIIIPSFLQPPAQPQVFHLRSTAYNSLESQTDSTPFITATGARTRSGLVALSRDLLEEIPYGTIVEIIDVRQVAGQETGCLATMDWVRSIETLPGLEPGQFVVEDTMHIRKKNQMDMWMESYDDAITWGTCEVTILAPASNTLAAK